MDHRVALRPKPREKTSMMYFALMHFVIKDHADLTSKAEGKASRYFVMEDHVVP